MLNARPQTPVNVIVDTDISDDCDDVGALAILHAMMDRGEANILGVVVNSTCVWSAPCVDAINTYYGRPNIPIGTLKGMTGLMDNETTYNQYITQNFPNDLKSGNNAPDATVVYRQILAQQPDKSVTIISIGFMRNLYNLLKSGSDSYSSLNGLALVTKKVKTLSVMGGQYPSGDEFNFDQDPVSSSYVVANWPTFIMFSGFEIGDPIMTGSLLYTKTPTTNPVRKAYELYVGVGNTRSSYDLTSVLYAVRGLSNYWTADTTGYNYVDGAGVNTWYASPDKRHDYLIRKMSNANLAKVIDTLLIKTPLITSTQTISQIETNNLHVFPNPVIGGELNIAGNADITEVSVFNLMGQKIDNILVNNSTAKLNTSTYNKGIYLLKISTKDGVINKRIIVE